MSLFDSDDNPVTIAERIDNFLKNRIQQMKASGNPGRDLLVYYVGHGDFDENRNYYLAIRYTQKDRPLISSIQVNSSGLANALRRARFLRRIIIVDACFAGASVNAFQSSGMAQEAFDKTKESFLVEDEDHVKVPGLPSRGTSLLCSSSCHITSRLSPDQTYTMFTEALLHILNEGNPNREEYMSLHTIAQLTRNYLQEVYGAEAALPLDDSPDQVEGDVADVSLFPNFALWSTGGTRLTTREFERKTKTIQCCVFVSEVESKRQDGESLELIIQLVLLKYKDDLEEISSHSLETEPYVFDISRVISSKEEYRQAIEVLCEIDIAIFDVTNYEPAIMLMLGIRSVVMRGVTILSLGGDFSLEDSLETPFNIKEVNIVSHSRKQLQNAHFTSDPIDLIGIKIKNGIRATTSSSPLLRSSFF